MSATKEGLKRARTRTWHDPRFKTGFPPRRMEMGVASVSAVAAKTKTSMIVDLRQNKWAERIRIGTRLELRALRVRGRLRRNISARVRVTAVCRHTGVRDIPSCPQGHQAERIAPHDPTWWRIQEAAVTAGGKLRWSKVSEVREAHDYLVVDFELLTAVEKRLVRPCRNGIEDAIAAVHSRLHLTIAAAARESPESLPEVSTAAVRLRSAYDRTLNRIGDDPQAIAAMRLEDLGFAPAELARLRELFPELAGIEDWQPEPEEVVRVIASRYPNELARRVAKGNRLYAHIWSNEAAWVPTLVEWAYALLQQRYTRTENQVKTAGGDVAAIRITDLDLTEVQQALVLQAIPDLAYEINPRAVPASASL